MKKILSILILVAAFSFAASSQNIVKIDSTTNLNGVPVTEAFVKVDVSNIDGSTVTASYAAYISEDCTGEKYRIETIQMYAIFENWDYSNIWTWLIPLVISDLSVKTGISKSKITLIE